MSGFTARVLIERSSAEVFDFMTDIQKSVRWIQGIISVESLTHGPVRTGTQWSEVRRLGERESKTIVEVSAHEGPKEKENPPYTHSIRSVNMGIENTYHYRVEHEGEEQCSVELTAIVRGTNIISRLFVPFAVKAMKKYDGDQLQKLKEVIESLPTGDDEEETIPFKNPNLILTFDDEAEDPPSPASTRDTDESPSSVEPTSEEANDGEPSSTLSSDEEPTPSESLQEPDQEASVHPEDSDVDVQKDDSEGEQAGEKQDMGDSQKFAPLSGAASGVRLSYSP